MQKTTSQLVRAMVALMQIRITSSSEETLQAMVKACAELLAEAQQHPAAKEPVIARLIEALDMQAKRESEELHLTSEAAMHIWHGAIAAGGAYLGLAEVRQNQNVVAKGEYGAETWLKQRAVSLGKALASYGTVLKHGQLLKLVARVEGHTGYSSLKAVLTAHRPNFCPHCGAVGTLQSVSSLTKVESSGIGQGIRYQCIRCPGKFAA